MSKNIDIIEQLRQSNTKYKMTFLFLVLLNLGLWVFFIFIHKDKPVVSEVYPLIDPAREFIPQKNFIINIQPLRDYINKLGEQEGLNLSVYYEQLNSGANIALNKDKRFYFASLVKLPVAMMTAKKVEVGDWSWDTELKVVPEDLDSGSGDMYKNTTKTSYTVREFMEALLVNSNNTAHNVLSKNFSQDEYQAIIDAIGLEELFDTSFKGSAKEYTRLLRSLYTSSFLDRDGSQLILDLMSKSKFNKFLSTGIPSDVKFSHKYGENTQEQIYADSGIVYVPGKPYVLTVIYKGSGPDAETKAEAIMKSISEYAYNISK